MLKPLLDINTDHFFGCTFAPIELVLYGDFQCEYCGLVYPEVKLLQEVMGNQLKYAFRHYPLPNLHPLALDAAVATEMAAVQDKFWQMHDIIFENQKYLCRASILRFAEEIGMDMTMFIDSREHKKLREKVITDFESGVKNGVKGTPTIFINGLRHKGCSDFDELYKACNYTLLLEEAELKQPQHN